jgi:hypothetical protein
MKKLVLLACLAVAAGANAQTYPTNRPISIVVPFAAGGPTDRVARDLAEAMRKRFRARTFVVENAAVPVEPLAPTRWPKRRLTDTRCCCSMLAWRPRRPCTAS